MKIINLRILLVFAFIAISVSNVTNATETKHKTVVLGDELKLVCNNINDIATVQWYKDGVMLDNCTGDRLIFKSAKLSDAGTYYAMVDGVCNLTRTNDLVVVVDVPFQPGIETAVAGGDFLFQNEPNPAGDRITFKFSISRATYTRLVLYDTFGKEVAVVFDGIASSGLNAVEFNALEYNLANGAYFYTINTNDFKETKSLMLIR